MMPLLPIQPGTQLAFTDGTNPIPGGVGEYQENYIVSASAVSLTSGTTYNFLTLNLLAGDWDIVGALNFGNGLLTLSNNVWVGISLVPLTFNTDPRSGYLSDLNRLSITLPRVRIKIPVGNDPTVLTPVYLLLKTTFSLSTLTAYGFVNARRPV